MLGIRLQGETLVIDPVIPSSWPQFEASFRHGETVYEIVVDNPRRRNRGVSAILLDGQAVNFTRPSIALVDDGKTHQVRVTLGTPDIVTENSP
jgi:cellobiose phosphorylase